jgi:putative ABC transport system permease protein
MTIVSLKGLWGRKLRTFLTALAIILGVAMISGTYVLTDTISAAFTTIFDKSYENADAVVSGKVAFKNTQSDTEEIPAFPASVLGKVRQLPDVAAAEGSISDEAKLVGRDGKTISHGFAASLAFSVNPEGSQRFNPLTLVDGKWPSGGTQIAIDQKTAGDEGYKVGDTIGVSTDDGVQQYEIEGIAKFASVSSIGGATIAIFDLPTAQRLFHKEGQLDEVQAAAKPGVTPAKLVDEIRPVLPVTAEVKTAEDQAKSQADDINEGISIFQKVLLAFAGVALFVGAFVIANTLSITIAQRVREFATIRTIGGSRRQVLKTVMVEALVVGIVASVIGLGVGLLLAKGLNALFVAIGLDFPKGDTVIATRTIVVSLLVGVIVTLLASLRPAIRATRVPPIAAVREGATLPPSRHRRLAVVMSVATLVGGILLLSYGIFGHGLSTANRLFSLAAGTIILFVGVAMNAKRTVRPLASVLGWPGTRIGGTSGQLARENAMRNPSRTASTASALMIGLALITFVAILGQGLRSSFEDAVDRLFVADYAVTAQNGFDPFSPASDEAVSVTPGVTAVSPIREGDARAFDSNIFVTAVPPNVAKTVRIDWFKGDTSVPSQLGKDGAFVDKDYAKDHDLSIGSPIPLETPTGKIIHLRVKGVFDPPNGGSPFGDVTMSNQTFDANYTDPKNLMTLINIKGGITDANTARLALSVNDFPEAKVLTAQEFKDTQEQFVNGLLNALYGLLGLSVIISLFGVVNTLVLSVFERTREIGMLRAVGMTRRQVRSMIRHESIVTALIGGALGVAVGFFLAALTTRALSDEGIVFAVPWLTIVVFIVATVIAGVLAAILPARRASRLNVLEALQYE